ncbi:MAG: HAD family hydrolase [Spirochaetia bacterium]
MIKTMSAWKKFDLYIFDFDGTVCNTEPGITRALGIVLEQNGYAKTRKDLQVFIGPPLKTSLQKYLGIQDETLLNKIVSEYREFYIQHKCTDDSALYPGMIELFQGLRNQGKRLAIASLKPQKGLDYLAKKYQIEQYFDAICGPDENETPATKEGVIDLVLAKVVDYKQPVLIGDSEFDVVGAHLREMPSIGVHYGFGDEAALAKADAHAQSVQELSNLIL